MYCCCSTGLGPPRVTVLDCCFLSSSLGLLLGTAAHVMTPNGIDCPVLLHSPVILHMSFQRLVSSVYLTHYLCAPSCAGTAIHWWILLGIFTWPAFLILLGLTMALPPPTSQFHLSSGHCQAESLQMLHTLQVSLVCITRAACSTRIWYTVDMLLVSAKSIV